jgi:hypothetical protein
MIYFLLYNLGSKNEYFGQIKSDFFQILILIISITGMLARAVHGIIFF